jgi:hypothetical protein
LEAKEQVRTVHERNFKEEILKSLPWYYRLAIFIANHLIVYTLLILLLGVLIGYIAG